MSGRVYRPTYTDRSGKRVQSKTWHLDYSIDGKRYRVSAKTTKKREADRKLHQRLAERGRGIHRQDVEKTTFADLKRLILADYEKKGQRSIRRLKTSLKHLEAAFGEWRAHHITAAAWASYQRDRLKAGAAAASINRERSALRRAFRLAVKYGLALEIPDLDRLPEDNVRDVEIAPAEFARLLEKLPPRLRPVAIVGFIAGWRKREILSRTWEDVDWEAGWLWLDRSTAKNRQPKAFPLGVVPWLDETLREQAERKRAIEKRTGRIVRPLFFFYKGPRAGEAFQDFRRAWATATDKAGLPGLRFHDLRRSAAVQLLEAGVPETHAQRIMGHKTRSMFDRYAISNRQALRSAGEKLGERYGTAPEPDRKVVSMGGNEA